MTIMAILMWLSFGACDEFSFEVTHQLPEPASGDEMTAFEKTLM
jgi:hypothetical protein